MKKRPVESIATFQLIADYKKIQSIEAQYWTLLKKYDPESTFESDSITVDILLELGRRQVK